MSHGEVAGARGASARKEHAERRRPGLGLLRRWGRSLSFRLALLMTLALLPLGLIGVSQTDQLQRELDRTRLLNLAVVTTDIARREGEAIDTALGAAAALAAVLSDGPPDAAACIAALERLAAIYDGRISFAAYVPRNGQVECATLGTGMDFSSDPNFEAMMANRAPFITSASEGPLSGVPVVTVHHPVFGAEGAFAGLVSLSVVDHGPLTDTLPVPNAEMVDFVLVNADGGILGARSEAGDALLPAAFDPADLRSLHGTTFIAEDTAGVTRRFGVAEAVSGAVYVVGSERAERLNGWSRLLTPESFPLFMWVASVILVFAVLEMSLMGPVRALAGRMRRFGETRRVEAPKERLPSELRAIETTFDQTAQRLLREEAELIDILYDRDVLLKEVHHRVKNNLQMISSMLNLQIREEEDPKVEETLEKVSGRIATLAAVHRQVYAAERPGAVRADDLLREVCVPLSETVMAEFPAADRPELILDLAPMRLTPDQAVPAAMLVVEALTTALHRGAESRMREPDGPDRWVRVSLTGETGEDVPGSRPLMTMSVVSNPHFSFAPQEGATSMTLGERLIRGFARQLRGTLDITWADDVNTVSLEFRALPFSPEVQDERDGRL